MKKLVIANIAHVDAGKTTLSEALLYQTGQIRKLGRVDHQDAFLDSDSLERERGITIFSKQARIATEDVTLTLLDTPGHVDFSAEMERTLQVIDYAVLVISGTDGVQSHTRTLWRLLNHYHIPTFLFVNKMDLPGTDVERIQKNLCSMLSDNCVNFSKEKADSDAFFDSLAMCNEEMMDAYMEQGCIAEETIACAIARREVFPCYYGSALKLEGTEEFFAGFRKYSKEPTYPTTFGARVYKVGRDPQGNRLTYLKVTGGTLQVKDRVSYQGLDEKIDQIRLYGGDKFEMVKEVQAGEVCAVTGLTATYPGLGLGQETTGEVPLLEPVLSYQILLPRDVNPVEMLGKLRQLEEEDPQLHIVWKEELKEIHAQMMGQVQIEVLTKVIAERFGVAVSFDQGNIVYKETIAKPVEGVGHFEPLRHYAEAHLLLEPGEPGSGIQVSSAVSEDDLDLNWQRLICTHVEEREHPGVLVGAVLTDVKITLVAGRAHLKHTEGGDFRQATYRAIRQGLKSTECVLLEPMYQLELEVPSECVGRAMSDLKLRFGDFEAPEFITSPEGERAILRGKAPVSTMQDYMAEVHSYTKGLGHLTLDLQGYDVCHNSEEVIAQMHYDSEADVANPTGSVFCAHGAGFVVPWDKVPDYMHLEYSYRPDSDCSETTDGLSYAVEGKTIAGAHLEQKRREKQEASSSWELDAQLQEIYQREFGMNKNDMLEAERKKWRKKNQADAGARGPKHDKQGNILYPKKDMRKQHLIVDGYNIIFALSRYKELANDNMDGAKGKLLDDLYNYKGYKRCKVTVVFDAYKNKEHPESVEDYHGITVVHTKTDMTADTYIEQMAHNLGGKEYLTVASNDNLEQITVLSQGAMRMSARQLEEEMNEVAKNGFGAYKENQKQDRVTLEALMKEVAQQMHEDCDE